MSSKKGRQNGDLFRIATAAAELHVERLELVAQAIRRCSRASQPRPELRQYRVGIPESVDEIFAVQFFMK